MTRFERITLFLSVAALFVSISMPFFTYEFLDVGEKEKKHRGILQVTTTELVSKCSKDGVPKMDEPRSITVNVQNIGHSPIKDVEVSISTADTNNPSLDVSIETYVVEPPRLSGHTLIYRITTPTAPNESFRLVVKGLFNSILIRPPTVDPVLSVFSISDLNWCSGVF